VNVLVDTSVWSLALRRKPEDLNPAERSTVRELSELICESRARMIGLVRQELVSGINSPAQFEKLRDTLRFFPDEPAETGDHESAALASNKCRAKGIAISAPNMLICAIAQARGWSIFSADPDFAIYAKHLSLKLHPIRR
jgi:predicted nucleic acid-binding protein